MQVLKVLLFTVGGLIVGVAAAVAVVATCNAVQPQVQPQNGPPEWIGYAGIGLLVLGPLAGAIVGFVVALRKGREPR